jgi:hypothetical protein
MAAETLLALWNDTATRRAIVDFVQAASTAYTTGAEDALDRAKTHGWMVVSMKEDWSAVFASA